MSQIGIVIGQFSYPLEKTEMIRNMPYIRGEPDNLVLRLTSFAGCPMIHRAVHLRPGFTAISVGARVAREHVGI